MRHEKNRKTLPPDDDGRTIANMNVDGMPWYTGGFRPPAEEDDREPDPDLPEMSKDERRGYMWAAVKAGLLISGVFAAAYGLFLLFCRFVWLK